MALAIGNWTVTLVAAAQWCGHWQFSGQTQHVPGHLWQGRSLCHCILPTHKVQLTPGPTRSWKEVPSPPLCPVFSSRITPSSFAPVSPLICHQNLNRGLESKGFPCSSVGKQSACSAGDPCLIPGLGRCHGEGNGNSLQYSCLNYFLKKSYSYYLTLFQSVYIRWHFLS